MYDFYTGELSTFDLPKYYPENGMNFHERKKARTDFYMSKIYKNKLIPCTSCSGYKYYCGDYCGWCEGTGKQRQR